MKYTEYLSNNKDLVAMIHVPALPGTPGNNLGTQEILDQVLGEAKLYQDAGINTVMIENMHDVPYLKHIGPEIIASMAVLGLKIKEMGLFCGIQILAAGNPEALACAKASNLDFVRVEGFVYAHIADEGYMDACAGELLRYRKLINATNVLIFTDIKKKHASHALTSDIDIVETAKTADFFLSEGIILTGVSTGEPADLQELKRLSSLSIRKIIGSGITDQNLKHYYPFADLFIVGSSLKQNGRWQNPPDISRVRALMAEFNRLKR